MNLEWGTPVACPKLNTRLGYHVPHYLVLVWILVDLPGVTIIPVRDQPHGIQRQIQDIPMCHIFAPNSVILWLLLADSDGLKMVIEPEASNSTHGFA
ncbi:hypothetical protein BS47DRAFT_143763 [Hydnum rufescens UP504]|uniref:Uncharacterized protein n=1 Tax=Hydnum rufescens UP504 TaxID=1448309 RepID=A0A9P6AQD0_9AGAM|nr:hypothetical protein BS47DRAFT_143763 [Hydnum rufescens UP504]